MRDLLAFFGERLDAGIYVFDAVIFGLGCTLEFRFQIFDVAAQTG